MAELNVAPSPPPSTILTLEDMLRKLPLPSDETIRSPATTKMCKIVSHRSSPRHPTTKANKGFQCAEVAGGTTAGCAALVCCPCGIVGLLVLATVKLPAGLCRRALSQKRRKRVKKRSTTLRSRAMSFVSDDEDFGVPSFVPRTPETWPSKSPSVEVAEKEEEMWAEFYSAGFWRSPSQKESN
uniref:Pollen preferential protein n=2 Tax=Lilium TaxID=4688 RepID=Q43713_LILLO|nr:pollen preferential protein [Lilium longiflorum]CAA78966.1 pollen preferential protein [Lilium longiflorum]CAA78977.1 pollen preferential protein [Lilium longiflorum]